MIDFSGVKSGPGVWVFNTEHLKNDSYRIEMENFIFNSVDNILDEEKICV